MNWDHIQGHWKQVTGKALEHWGKLTLNNLHVVAGRRAQLAGKLQKRRALAKEDAARPPTAGERKTTQGWFEP